MIIVVVAVLFCLVVPAIAGDGAQNSSESDEREHQRPSQTKAGPPLILAHYMPWYTAKPASDRWGWRWTMNRFDPEKQVDGRREIASKHYPLIGPYDSGDVQVLEYHLLTMKLAGIDGVIVDWYGLTDFNDYAVLHRNTTRLLQQCERLQMKFVICYEDQTVPLLVKGTRIRDSDRVGHVVGEINWLGQYWFKSASYLRFDGQPVLLSFGHSGLTDVEWTQCLEKLESPVRYYSQDYRRDGAIGGFGWPSPQRGMGQVDRFLSQSRHWPDAIPAAFPRFLDIYRDAGVSEGYPDLPDNNGKTFRATLAKAIAAKPRMIQLVTWNDWGEGTQIEPSQEFGYRDLEYLQVVQRTSLGSSSVPSPEDLRLPYKILQSRRSGTVDASQLDRAVERLSSGQFEEVESLLNSGPTGR
jgi:hypothetical protein